MKKSTFNLIFGLAFGSIFSFIFAKNYYEKVSEDRIKEMEKEVNAYARSITEKNEKAKQELQNLFGKIETEVLNDKGIFKQTKSISQYKDYDRVQNIFRSDKEFSEEQQKAYSDLIEDMSYDVKSSAMPAKVLAEAVSRNEEEEEENDESEEDEEELPPYPTYPVEGPKDYPYSITPESFSGEYPYFDKVTLVYFKNDHVLAYDDTEEEVSLEDLDEIGNNFVNLIGEYEDGVAYIRNEKSGTDYEIIVSNDSYADHEG